jgi:hypothetical protein
LGGEDLPLTSREADLNQPCRASRHRRSCGK